MSPRLQALIAEVTHRCPLHCVYCSNPLELEAPRDEMAAGEWEGIFRQARELGALQLHLTGGEPLARRDIVELVRAGRGARLYVNLITSGIGLTPERMDELAAAGLDHVQLSMQGADMIQADEIAGTKAHTRKLEVARLIRGHRVAFTLNIVVHRQNLDRLDAILALAEELHPDKLEIANVQYYGWALRNRQWLLPTRSQLDASLAKLLAAQERLKGCIRLDFVLPDYYAKYPKACMGGWGQALMLLSPAGKALPCHAAGILPGLDFPSAKENRLRWIWEESPAFQKFRGEDWMQEPCRTCERRGQDFGGCRCQAFALTGDAAATDPTCSLAPKHQAVIDALKQIDGAPSDSAAMTSAPDWVYRIENASR